MSRTSLADWQLGRISARRNAVVWTVRHPVAPGSSRYSTSDAMTYDAAKQAAFAAATEIPWLRTASTAIEILCDGKFVHFQGAVQ